jgi:GH43 family beta-xylosidase
MNVVIGKLKTGKLVTAIEGEFNYNYVCYVEVVPQQGNVNIYFVSVDAPFTDDSMDCSMEKDKLDSQVWFWFDENNKKIKEVSNRFEEYIASITSSLILPKKIII